METGVFLQLRQRSLTTLICVRVFFVMCAVFMLNTTEAHKINGYKYIHVEETGNLYGVEDKLTAYFTSIGFTPVASYEIEDMTSLDKGYLLIATYEWNIVNGGSSTLVVTFSDLTGTVIYRVSGQGISWTAKGDMSYALKKIFKKLDTLNYEFDPNQNKAATSDDYIQFASWTEDSIKRYLINKNIQSLEGIYKNYSNDLNYYRFAILKQKDTYYGVILETENKRWEKGDIKMVLHPIEKNVFDVEYYDFKGKRLNSIGKYEDRILSFSTSGSDGEIVTFQYLKVFPSNSLSESIEKQNSNDVEIKGTGSGFVISSNVIATNYHVIADATIIKIALNMNGSIEEYNARVLSIDKKNDLALLTIKDERFKGLNTPPYKIISNTTDVGTSVFTMGYPMSNILGKDVKITDGLISSKTGYEDDAVTYQISVPIQPGNSGGALFDKKGNLVGITNAAILSADNVGYAIKSSYLLNLIDSAPIDIELPRGENFSGKELPEIVKAYTPFIVLVKVY